jgi:hypothetical protein
VVIEFDHSVWILLKAESAVGGHAVLGDILARQHDKTLIFLN